MGSGSVLLLALPAAPVLAWQLALVARRAERRRYDVEIAASAVLALTAPAALWTGQGRISLAAGALLWLLLSLHAAGTILHAALRLKQRALKAAPSRQQSLRMALPALGYNLALWLGIAGLAAAHHLPAGLALAYAIQPLEVLWAALHPTPGIAPQKIGFRQLAVTGLFGFVFIVAMKI
jgi:hypothetical protein